MDNTLIEKINNTLKKRKNCTVNIINDKLTLAVFSMLKKNLKNVRNINFIIRDTRSLPRDNEVYREFELSPNDALFNAYDIMEKNKLLHFEQAKSMYEFIKDHVVIKKNTEKCQIKGNLLLIDEELMIQGSSSLEFSPKAQKSNISHINFDSVIYESMDKEQIKGAGNTFNQIWNRPDFTVDYKEEILSSLESLYKDHSPQFLYYVTLYELFGNQLDEGVTRFENDTMNFKGTKIWNMLYDFQRDCVISAIQKINKYNGCIIADSVGLGKTFEALAIIKYFEMRQDNVLVLAPAKLYNNWNSFKGAYKDSILDETFYYKIMFHTDLSRYKGESRSGWDLSRFDWSKFDLVVIDESHNFRNRTEKEFGKTRYQRLLEDVIQQGRNTKVLLLSATPVNNSLNDLKNQISIMTADRDDAFKDAGIASISNLLNRTSRILNQWEKQNEKNEKSKKYDQHKKQRDKELLLNQLPGDFYRILEKLSISRSRKHITTYYGTDQVGRFPKKLKPDTYTPHIDTKKQFLNFKTTNMQLEELILAVYMPMSYIKSEYRAYYREQFQTKYNNKIIFSHEDREFITSKLHRFNLFKRLDSSVYAFGETIRRLRERIESYIDLLERNLHDEKMPENNMGYMQKNNQKRDHLQESEMVYDLEEDEDDAPALDYKYKIKVRHLDTSKYLNDLYYDMDILNEIYREVTAVLEEKRDNKLHTLKTLLKEKIKNTPYNKGNRKVLIFTAFADTARYLYDSLLKALPDFKADIDLTAAMINGTDKPSASSIEIEKTFDDILSAFSPCSRIKAQLPPEKQVDILIGTDCISEGQNLQDCDCVINYDIQWNPVTLIQRFGRIDRIGSSNNTIKMINFFPDMALNEYLSLEKRVKSKMISANISSTGDEDVLSPEMNDISFRNRQLERLREEVIDIDEAGENISLTDLNMNEYLFELAEYVKQNPEVREVPRGIYAVTQDTSPPSPISNYGEGEIGTDQIQSNSGVIFCFKHRKETGKPENDSTLYPYYLVFMDKSENVLYGNSRARELLKVYRKLCYGAAEPVKPLIDKFLKETDHVKDMSLYSRLLNSAINSIQGQEEAEAEQSIFDFSGYNNPFAGETADDFELVSFLIVD
ncbi:MAG: DEAD/DEAH box helicase family protein [Desulfamplus sp.]|nr:DEAD/DEAH box helicase family protein [Desulfamplus sp.]